MAFTVIMGIKETWRTLQLGYNYPLSAIDHKNTIPSHQGK